MSLVGLKTAGNCLAGQPASQVTCLVNLHLGALPLFARFVLLAHYLPTLRMLANSFFPVDNEKCTKSHFSMKM
jgi:hypothetical protein